MQGDFFERPGDEDQASRRETWRRWDWPMPPRSRQHKEDRNLNRSAETQGPKVEISPTAALFSPLRSPGVDALADLVVGVLAG